MLAFRLMARVHHVLPLHSVPSFFPFLQSEAERKDEQSAEILLRGPRFNGARLKDVRF